jgi:hypothetical protein
MHGNPIEQFTPSGNVYRTAKLGKLGSGQTGIILSARHTADHNSPSSQRNIGGSADIHYRITVVPNHDSVSQGLLVSDLSEVVATQSLKELQDTIKSIRPKAETYLRSRAESSYDQRGFAYVLGFYAARTAMSGRYIYRQNSAQAQPIDTQATQIAHKQMYVHSGMYNNNDEYVTLMQLIGESGVETAIHIDDFMPMAGNMLRGLTLGAYCLRLASLVVVTADSLGAGNLHALAFCRGVNCALELNSHTEEGGWIRRVLKNATYPTPHGILSTTMLESGFLGVSPSAICPTQIVRKVVCDALLVLGYASTCADPGNDANDGPLILQCGTYRVNPSTGTASEFNGIIPSVKLWYNRLTQNFASLFNLSCSEIADYGSLPRMETIGGDRHLEGKAYILPFFWVEPVGIECSKDVTTSYYSAFGRLADDTDLPVFASKTVVKARNYSERKGRVSSGSQVMVVLEQTRLRNNGFSYIYNSLYNPEDGLATLQRMSVPQRGIMADPLFMADGPDYGNSLWGVWDSCIPNPMNGIVDSQGVGILYTYIDRRISLSAEELVAPGAVSFSTSHLAIMSYSKYSSVPDNKKIVKSVPKWIQRYMNNVVSYSAGQPTFQDEWSENFPMFEPSLDYIGGEPDNDVGEDVRMDDDFGDLNELGEAVMIQSVVTATTRGPHPSALNINPAKALDLRPNEGEDGDNATQPVDLRNTVDLPELLMNEEKANTSLPAPVEAMIRSGMDVRPFNGGVQTFYFPNMSEKKVAGHVKQMHKSGLDETRPVDVLTYLSSLSKEPELAAHAAQILQKNAANF